MLETKIDALTAAIERLIAALPTVAAPDTSARPAKAAKATAAKATDDAPKAVPAPVETPPPAAAPIDRDELQTRCITFSRVAAGNNVKLKAAIAEMAGGKYSLLKDVPDDELQAFVDRLTALEATP